MPKISDPVVMTHPALPDAVITVGRPAVPAHKASGWVEAKSPEAPVAVETNSSPERDATPSKEKNK